MTDRTVAHTGSAVGAAQVRVRVDMLRRGLVRVRLVRAMLWAALVAVAAAFLLRAASWLAVALSRVGPDAANEPATFLQTMGSGMTPWLVGVVVGVLCLVWQRSRWSPITPVRAALWYEERHPRAHALVTLASAEAGTIPDHVEELLARQVAFASAEQVPAGDALRAATWHAWRAPLVGVCAATIGLVLVSLLPQRGLARGVANAARTTLLGNASGTESRTNRLATWRVEIAPPAYSGQPARRLTDSTSVEALVGSRIRVIGAGAAAGLVAVWEQRGSVARLDTLSVSENGNDWQAVVTMPSQPSVLRVYDGPDSRLLALVPRPDSLPVVRLVTPERDSVFRDTTGTLTLLAEARDDLGLRSLVFEVILTSGAGEQYVAKTITLGRKTIANRGSASAAYTTSFSALGVAPGDVMHVRAVARDGHPAADREAGVSETRSLRFARAGEYDSVAVEAAPPPAVDSSMLSQRMLLEMTQKLEARRTRIARTVLVSESRQLATEQARIRRAVSAIVFQRLSGDGESEHVHYEGDGHDVGLTAQDGKLVPTFGGAAGSASTNQIGVPPVGASGQPNNNASDESPIIAVNRPLLEAYNAMWDAGRELELADTRAAIPHMLRALEAIQRARAAERIYLRGSTRAVVVDLARVRLAGRDTGLDSRRAAGPVLPDAERVLEGRLLSAAELLATNAVAARDSLVALRLDALSLSPELSRALESVLTAISTGDDATAPLIRARRTLGAPRATRGLSAWSTP